MTGVRTTLHQIHVKGLHKHCMPLQHWAAFMAHAASCSWSELDATMRVLQAADTGRMTARTECLAKCSGMPSCHIANVAQAAEQELELPEDMALDGDGMADADNADEGGPDAPEAEGDAPETFPEQRDAGADDGEGAEEADQDADMADQGDAQDGVHAHLSYCLLSC